MNIGLKQNARPPPPLFFLTRKKPKSEVCFYPVFKCNYAQTKWEINFSSLLPVCVLFLVNLRTVVAVRFTFYGISQELK